MWTVAIIVMATNGAIAALIRGRAGPLDLDRGAALGWSVGAVAASLDPRWSVGAAPAARTSSGTLRAAVVQPGEHVPDHPLTQPLIVRRQYAELTEVITALHAPPTAAARGAQLVVWPEASGWVDPLTPTGTSAGAAGGRRGGAVGRRRSFGPISFASTAITRATKPCSSTRSGRLSAPHDQGASGLGDRRTQHHRRTAPGLCESTVWPWRLALGPDGSYTDALARLARDGAQVVAVPTHDWAAYAGTQLAHLRVRAAEHRLAIVKADWRYGSAIVAHRMDSIVAVNAPRHPSWKPCWQPTWTSPRPARPYSVSGDWLGVVSLVVAVTAVRGRGRGGAHGSPAFDLAPRGDRAGAAREGAQRDGRQDHGYHHRVPAQRFQSRRVDGGGVQQPGAHQVDAQAIGQPALGQQIGRAQVQADPQPLLHDRKDQVAVRRAVAGCRARARHWRQTGQSRAPGPRRPW